METYGKVVAMALPVFLFLVIAEKLYGIWKGEDHVPIFDAISSMLSGATNAVKDVLELSFTVITYQWLVQKCAITYMPQSIWMYLIVFLVLDFQGYWTHRWAHEINFFWNKHLIHHSSEEFNLACALRQSLASFVNIFTFFLIPAALLGVPAIVVATIAPIHLFAQFWYHTRYIQKMGILEHVLVTPSHHRVHHAINPEYLDKNYSQIFIFWDKLFDTFQPELPDIKPVYGITRPVQTFNPIKINFQHLFLLFRDAWRTKNWSDKLAIWFKPTGWRPADVASNYPVHKIENVYNFTKFNTNCGQNAQVFLIFQLIASLALAAYFFSHIGLIGSPGVFLYGAFFFVHVYAITEWMDGNRDAIYWEIAKCIFGFSVIYFMGSWFKMDQIFSNSTYAISAFLVTSFLGVATIKVQPVNRIATQKLEEQMSIS
jgi:alkylglycerol monooxygenase